MHVLSNEAEIDNIHCAGYMAADGICSMAENNFAKMTSDISTVGMTGIDFSFWYLCGGESGTNFGEVYYSTDGGTNWLLKQTNYSGMTGWTQETLTDAAWENQTTLRFAFRFVNNVASAPSDPSFSIDDVEVTASAGSSNTITTVDDVAPGEWCSGTTQSLQVNFIATGTFNASNVYMAELSDETGSFASPQTIGSLTSSSNGALAITATVPGSVNAGNGYRVRVVSSDPQVIGSDNTTDLISYDPPSVTLNTFTNVCDDTPVFQLTGGSPSGGTYSGTGVSGGNFDPSVAGVGTHTITYSYTNGNGCTGSQSQSLVVDPCSSLDELESYFIIYPNPVSKELFVQTNLVTEKLTLIDVTGRQVLNADESILDVSQLSKGVYVLRITVGNNQIEKRIIVD